MPPESWKMVAPALVVNTVSGIGKIYKLSKKKPRKQARQPSTVLARRISIILGKNSLVLASDQWRNSTDLLQWEDYRSAAMTVVSAILNLTLNTQKLKRLLAR